MKTLKTVFLSCCSILFAANSFALEVGDKAPEFTAISTAGEITLSEIIKQGPVVLAFYYADFTPV
jgi:peroxiredoxin